LNGRESAVNRALDGSTYPGYKLLFSCHCKKIVVKKLQQLILVVGNAI
jgi:hypothetical protein